MSDSRLEKFIYAICSMDVSDLPVPLSRIEKLWNCLITGETPDFEPLSRNEKYLMAMLDRYDISNLPAPMSRGEKLLYKIAVGETDLSDVPGYLSRYEELLKYLIENGGISGGDFEYVLYTLNQSLSILYLTAEKPVKSAILKGNTLINIKGEPIILQSIFINNERKKEFLVPLVKPNTNYYIKYDSICANSDTVGISFLTDVNVVSSNKDLLPLSGSMILNSGNEPNYFRITGTEENSILTVNNLSIIEYQEGMENWDIPYFTGMQSVKMPVLTTTGKRNFVFEKDKTVDVTYGTISNSPNDIGEINFLTIPSEPFIITGELSWKTIAFYDENKTFISALRKSTVKEDLVVNTSDMPSNTKYFRFGGHFSSYGTYESVIPTIKVTTISGDIIYDYLSSDKTNILTVNDDVELRGIGEVQDELNLMAGELTERIGEITFDGSDDENWNILGLSGSGLSIGFYISINNKKSVIVKCDKLPLTYYDDIVGIKQGGSESVIQIRMTTEYLTSLDLNSFKIWLAQNPLTIQYKLATESIKTVDLTTVDQDGQPTKLKTFNDITHVEINSDSIIPTVEIEVATKISETLSTMDAQHHDVSETQNELGQIIDEQSENTDATMMATTEIYEQIL